MWLVLRPKLFFMVATSMLIFSCASIPESDALLRDKCIKSGGIPDDGLGGYYGCGNRYADAGKECRSSNECEGDCLLKFGWKPKKSNEEVVGNCEHNDLAWEIGLCWPIEKKDQEAICLEE